MSLDPECTEDIRDVGFEGNGVSQCRRHSCLSHYNHVGGDTRHVGKRRRGAGLSANQIPNVMRLQGLACCRRDERLKKTVCDLKASTISFYSSFQD